MNPELHLGSLHWCGLMQHGGQDAVCYWHTASMQLHVMPGGMTGIWFLADKLLQGNHSPDTSRPAAHSLPVHQPGVPLPRGPGAGHWRRYPHQGAPSTLSVSSASSLLPTCLHASTKTSPAIFEFLGVRYWRCHLHQTSALPLDHPLNSNAWTRRCSMPLLDHHLWTVPMFLFLHGMVIVMLVQRINACRQAM